MPKKSAWRRNPFDPHWRDRFKADEKPVQGRLINTTSAAGLYGNFGQVNDSAVKAAIIALITRWARASWGAMASR